MSCEILAPVIGAWFTEAWPLTMTPSTGKFFAGAYEDNLSDLESRNRHRSFDAVCADDRSLRNGAYQRFDRCSRTVGVQIGDELGDQDNHHEDRAGHRLPAENGDESSNGDEDFRADLTLGVNVDQARLDQRVEADSDRGPENIDRGQLLPV